MSNDSEINERDFNMDDIPVFSCAPFTLEEVSPEIQEKSRNVLSFLLRKMGEQSLDAIGDKMHMHRSNVWRMKQNGGFEKMSAVLAALDIDISAMEKQIADLQEQNAAYRVLLAAKLNEQKEKPEISSN